jgi:uncharacterized surface protein with fasciclin (FAS1) repeats
MSSKIITLFSSLLCGCMAGTLRETVVDVAVASPDHTTLVGALTAAGLVDVLLGEGPFTVFAPTNAAFDADPSLAKYLEPEWLHHLQDILTYHVASGMVPSGALQLNQTIQMVNEGFTTITSLHPPMVNDANIVTADLMGGNGIVHVIDKVLNPLQTITDLALSLPDTFSTLVDLVVLAGLDGALAGEGPFTLFAPTNEAFAALDNATVAFLLNDTAALTDVLLYHVFPGLGFSADLENGAVITMLNNETTTIGVTSSTLGGDEGAVNAVEKAELNYFVNDAMVVAADILASNGVIHVIDKVLT